MAIPELEELPRSVLVPVALDYMLSGMIVTRAMLPQIVVRGGDFDLMNQLAIDEWMGASPVYTARMRRLMHVEGDDVEAIMKVLQLDVGFVHQYMDVGYRVIDPQHAEFWLAHCGALMDTEPHGEEQVFGMCHTIEDPTFDATARGHEPPGPDPSDPPPPASARRPGPALPLDDHHRPGQRPGGADRADRPGRRGAAAGQHRRTTRRPAGPHPGSATTRGRSTRTSSSPISKTAR